MFNYRRVDQGFTIVELLVVIVVIGILAAITIVSYSGIVNRANIAALQSELSSTSKKLSIYYVQNGVYPSSLDGSSGCPTAPISDTSNCIKFSSPTTYTYNYKSASSFSLTATRGSLRFSISSNNSVPANISLNPADWMTIGTQMWQKRNMNIGTLIGSAAAQSDNSTLEKYCYNNSEAECDASGAFYLWGEAMQYSSSEGAQGICPAGSHIPTDSDWKTLELYLGMSQAEVDSVGWRGAGQATKLKVGGSTTLDMSLSGYRTSGGGFSGLAAHTYIWSSTASATDAWSRNLSSSFDTIDRVEIGKMVGASVRCVAD